MSSYLTGANYDEATMEQQRQIEKEVSIRWNFRARSTDARGMKEVGRNIFYNQVLYDKWYTDILVHLSRKNDWVETYFEMKIYC